MMHYLPWEANMAMEIIEKHFQDVLSKSFSTGLMDILDYRRYWYFAVYSSIQIASICSQAEVVTPSLKMNELKQPQSEATEAFFCWWLFGLIVKHPRSLSGMVPIKGSVISGTQGGMWYPAGTCCLGLVACWVVLSCFVLFCLVLPFVALSCLILSCLVVSCFAFRCLVLSCFVLLFVAL